MPTNGHFEAPHDPTHPVDLPISMRAIVQRTYGDADTLELSRVAVPSVPASTVLVEVRAAGVDRGVAHLMTGLPYLIRVAGFGLTRPKQQVPGLDVAGTVVAVGEGVTRFAVGDEVFGIARGAFAEYALADEGKLATKPSAASYEQAGVAAISGITALQALTDVAKARSGQRVLVLGASGGVGSFAVQIAKAIGCEVTGACRSSKVDFVRALGADHVIDYTAADPVDLDDGAQHYDIIVDIGGRRGIRALRDALTPTGTLVIVGGEHGNRLTGGVGRQLRAMLLSPFVGQRLTTFISKERATDIERLAELIENGSVVPAVGATFPLPAVPDAIRRLEAGDALGKTAIVVPDSTA